MGQCTAKGHGDKLALPHQQLVGLKNVVPTDKKSPHEFKSLSVLIKSARHASEHLTGQRNQRLTENWTKYRQNAEYMYTLLHFSLVKFFQFMPHVLDRIQVRRLSWSFPPIDFVAPEKVGTLNRCMFGSLSCMNLWARGNFSKVKVSPQSFHRKEITLWFHQKCRYHFFPV